MIPDELKIQAGLESWHFQLDNPTLVGWTVVGVYEMAALACARAALLRNNIDTRTVWWILAAALCFLGVNKQLNLQTLLIFIGRNLAFKGGWLPQRRTAQLIFSSVFTLAVGVTLGWLAFKHRSFFKKNRLAFWGVIVLGVFVAMRAATINHVDEFLKINLYDQDWAWLLEITGGLLLGIAALRRMPGRTVR